jgi:hypothetical protein
MSIRFIAFAYDALDKYGESDLVCKWLVRSFTSSLWVLSPITPPFSLIPTCHHLNFPCCPHLTSLHLMPPTITLLPHNLNPQTHTLPTTFIFLPFS